MLLCRAAPSQFCIRVKWPLAPSRFPASHPGLIFSTLLLCHSLLAADLSACCPHAPDPRVCTGQCSRCLPRSRRYRRRPRWGPPSQGSVPFPCQTKSALPWRQKQALTMEMRPSWLCGYTSSCATLVPSKSIHAHAHAHTRTPC